MYIHIYTHIHVCLCKLNNAYTSRSFNITKTFINNDVEIDNHIGMLIVLPTENVYRLMFLFFFYSSFFQGNIQQLKNIQN